MAVGVWHGLTVMYLEGMPLDQLVPDVVARNCPHLHTLHIHKGCHSSRLMGHGMPLDAWHHALHDKTYDTKIANPDYNIRERVRRCASRVVSSQLRPAPCPQLRHLTVHVCSEWLQLHKLFADEKGARKDLIKQMLDIWRGLYAQPCGIIRIKLAELAAESNKERQQLSEAADALEAAWEEAHEKELYHLDGAISELQDRVAKEVDGHVSQQPGKVVDWMQVCNALGEVNNADMPWLDVRGNCSGAPVAHALQQAQLLQSASVALLKHSLGKQISKLKERVSTVIVEFGKQKQQYYQWWRLHSKLVMCHDNAQYAQQLHQELQPQIQQQLAALPNLSSLHIIDGQDLPAGLAEGVLQLGSQLTKLELGTVNSLDNLPQPSSKETCVMPQQLGALCCQLTNLLHLQWDTEVHDDGMRNLLKLPRLQHITMVTNLSQSFADAECSWQSLTTFHRPTDCTNGNSTCKQLSYLPLRTLQRPVTVIRAHRIPQLFSLTADTAADLQTVQQACTNVAQCGGVLFHKYERCFRKPVHPPVPDAPRIVFMPEKVRHSGKVKSTEATLQQLQVLEASLPLFKQANMRTVELYCTPLTAGVLSVLTPQLAAWGVQTLDFTRSCMVPGLVPQLLSLLPMCIDRLAVEYSRDFCESDAYHSLTDETLLQLCAGAVRPITVQVATWRRLFCMWTMEPRVANVTLLVQLTAKSIEM